MFTLQRSNLFTKLVMVMSILFVSLTLSFSNPALAHTGFDKSSPPANAVVTDELKELTLTFEGKLESLSTFKLFDSNKQETKLDKVLLKDKVMTGTLTQPLSNGTYEVQWTIVGEDGHPIQGKYSFSVKREGDKQAPTELKTSPSPSATVVPTSTPSPITTEIEEVSTSSNYLIYGGIGALVIIALVILLFARRKK
ncbi:copper resistance CopC family protein [Paenibacillus alginolyticus]|uniref:Copper resistance protein CopC n=1 Tax=Paenibacillus alginolyticus TaxID=59839 RepID=A0ABT4GIX8_9BACL|nr:copper resistance protein CopC [Paenibacillus alginolyticus]MCY9696167.1 copper resistance protein CopC [Paenibacillus alginolyticus]MEC0143320.1 copper resistance protein CopC [Paenibacillus alginolyticus]